MKSKAVQTLVDSAATYLNAADQVLRDAIDAEIDQSLHRSLTVTLQAVQRVSHTLQDRLDLLMKDQLDLRKQKEDV